MLRKIPHASPAPPIAASPRLLQSSSLSSSQPHQGTMETTLGGTDSASPASDLQSPPRPLPSSAETLSPSSSIPSGDEEDTPTDMPYSLSRWARYPRSGAPPPSLTEFVQRARGSRRSFIFGERVETRRDSDSSFSNKYPAQTFPVTTDQGELSGAPEDRPPKAFSSPAYHQPGKGLHLDMCYDISSTKAEVGDSRSASSKDSFETADSRNRNGISADVQDTKSDGSKESSGGDAADQLTALIVSMQTSEPQEIQSPQILHVAAPVDHLPAASSDIKEPISATLGNKNSSQQGLTLVFHGKDERGPPPVPPKPTEYQPAIHQPLKENKSGTTVQKSVEQLEFYKNNPPTMLIFQVIKTSTNPETRKCEYHLRYNWSGDNPAFPDGPTSEDIFLFDGLCMHKAVIARLRVWHSSHICISKDPRIEDMKYRLSPAEYTEINQHPWPPFNPRGWLRCLIWGNFGIESSTD
ncbi:hypothetical protein TWF281_003073 [Arthrobotrys megalospora]